MFLTTLGLGEGHSRQPYTQFVLERLILGLEPTTYCFCWKALAILPGSDLYLIQLYKLVSI